jgi:hypothetical protein
VLLPLDKRTYLGAPGSWNMTTHNINTDSNTLLVHEQPRTDTVHALTTVTSQHLRRECRVTIVP